MVSQREPLPVWSVLELELYNALRFKVFIDELTEQEVDGLLSTYRTRKRAGQYHVPFLDPVALHERAIELTLRTPTTGCRSLDILHVAAADPGDDAQWLLFHQPAKEISHSGPWGPGQRRPGR